MAKHKSWHGADRKRALRAKLKIEKTPRSKTPRTNCSSFGRKIILKIAFLKEGRFLF